jgi:hypothetical protein
MGKRGMKVQLQSWKSSDMWEAWTQMNGKKQISNIGTPTHDLFYMISRDYHKPGVTFICALYAGGLHSPYLVD